MNRQGTYPYPAKPLASVVAIACALTLCPLLSGCHNGSTASNGNSDDAAHQQSKALVQQNLQNAANASAADKARAQQGMQMGQEAIQRNNAMAHIPHRP